MTKARPVLLDLYCGAGGAAMGYHRAGFEIVGVDIAAQRHYPFHFIQADALAFDLAGFDAIHASPPCQGYSRTRHLPWLAGSEYPLLIDATRARLQQAGVPYVIENVEDSPLERRPTLFGIHGVLLCGTMFDLPIYRHRPFESNVILRQPAHRPHAHTIAAGRMFGRGGDISTWERTIRMTQVMGCEWMTQKECGQAIPPAYTQHIGADLIAVA